MLTVHNTGYTFMSAILTDRLHSAIARLSVNSRHRILGLTLAMDASVVRCVCAPDLGTIRRVVLLRQS
jgi:hypothetical protein